MSDPVPTPLMLVSWEDTQAFLKLGDDQESLATFLIQAASLRAQQIARRSFTSEQRTFICDGDRQRRIVLPVFPVQAVTNVWLDESRTWAEGDALGTAEFGVDLEAGIVKFYTRTAPKAMDSVRIDYEAGFAEVPQDVQQAVLEVVSFNIKRFEGQKIGERAVMGPDGMNLQMELTIPLNAQRVFEGYR